MPDVTLDDLLSEPDVVDAIERNEAKEGNIRRAAEQVLMRSQSPLDELKRAIPVILRGRLKIFFSYKMSDGAKAQQIVDQLRALSGRVEIEFAGDFPRNTVGKDWRDRIEKAIEDADWLILLLPDPAEEWDWCLFEAGIFYGQRIAPSVERLICLHHPEGEIPSQIDQFQSVPSTAEKVKAFLEQTYLQQDAVPGLDPFLQMAARENVESSARVIVDAIEPPRTVERIHYDDFFSFRVPLDLEADGDEAILDAQVVDTSSGALKIFGRIEQPETLRELFEGVSSPDGNTRWLKELTAVVRQVVEGKAFRPIQTSLRAHQSARFYRVVLHAGDRIRNDNSLTLQVALIEDTGSVRNDRMPKRVRDLDLALQLAFRFRWEIIEVFLDANLNEQDIELMADQLDRLSTELTIRDLDLGALVAIFTEGARAEIQDMVDTWLGLRKEDHSGALDLAINARDVDGIKAILGELSRKNRRFYELACQRMLELID